MSTLDSITAVVVSPFRRVVRALVAPSEEERRRAALKPWVSREDREEAAKRHVDSHIRDRDERRARRAREREEEHLD
jgi:hypothetical protein